MDKIGLLSKISVISEKNDLYYVFKGLLFNLEPEEVCNYFDVKLSQDSYKKDLIIDKILKDLNIYQDIRTKSYGVSGGEVDKKRVRVYLTLFKKLLTRVRKAENYRFNQQYAKFLYRMCPAMPISWQKELLKYFLASEYRSNQRRALEYLSRNWDLDFSDDVIRLWCENYFDVALKVVIWRVDNKYLNSEVLKAIDEYFGEAQDEGYFEYNYDLKILRNKFYSRFASRCADSINKIKEIDPISYIYIKKECGEMVEQGYAIKTYRDNVKGRKYLPRWYAEMGMSDVLDFIINV